jgi:putative NADH-flavin reductase
MKVLILGATGATGRLLVERALDRGHQVTAFVRDPRKLVLPEPSPALNVVQGNVMDPAGLDRIMPGHDAVIFAVGPGHNKASTLRTDGARNTVAAMTKAGVQRLIAISGLGAGVTRKNLGFVFDQIQARTTLKGLLQDQNGMESEIRKSKLDWVVVRPGTLLDTPPTLKCVISLDGTDLQRSVSRADLVHFMLDQLQQNEYVRKPVAIGMPDYT